jgi:hypothetical protein
MLFSIRDLNHHSDTLKRLMEPFGNLIQQNRGAFTLQAR